MRQRISGSISFGVAWVGILVTMTSVCGADCNGNGVADAADIENATSADCNGNGMPDECEREPFHFAAVGHGTVVARVPLVLRSGDLDGDGDPDVVAGSRLASSVISVFLNTGDGRHGGAVEYQVPGRLFTLCLADVDGSGSLDVVSANASEIVVLLNRGDGTFGELTTYPFSGEVRFVTAADVTGDGVLDLLTVDRRATTIALRVGDAPGIFAAPSQIVVSADPAAIATADLDLDGDLDLAVVARAGDPGDVSVLLNDGDGTFRLSGPYALDLQRPAEIRIADLDGDGLPDLVASAGRYVAILTNRGAGAFSEAVIHDDGSIIDLAIEDLDDDGDLDLVTTGRAEDFEFGGMIRVRLNDGQGGLDAAVEVQYVEPPAALDTGDFDGDGTPDLVVSTLSPSIVVVLRNVYGRTTAVTRELISPIVGCIRERIGCRPHAGAAVDLDGDGDIDILGSNTHPGSFTILRNDGRGVMTAEPAQNFTAEQPVSVAVGDLDGDGDADAVTVDHLAEQIQVHLNTGDGTFFPAVRYTVGRAPRTVNLADLDGNGSLDAISANQSAGTISVLFNRGDGTLQEKFERDYRVGSSPLWVEPADLDGDGNPDIVITRSRASSVTIFFGDGTGRLLSPVDVQLPGPANHVSSADLDGDGHIDLVTSITSRSRLGVLINRGDGTFLDAGEVIIGRTPYSSIVVDFDSDGVLDLVAASSSGSGVSIVSGLGGGSFGLPLHVRAGEGLRFAFPGDLDGDGDIDLVTNDRQGRSFTVIYNESPAPPGDYLESICTPWDYFGLSTTVGSGAGSRRFLKYTLTADGLAAGALRSVVFQNTGLYALHEDFLGTVLPDLFPALDANLYDALVGRRGTRQYFVGTISRLRTEAGIAYGFSVFALFDDPLERLTAAEVKGIHDRLRDSFHLEPFGYYPNTRASIDVARQWANPGFLILEVDLPPGERYAAYTRSVGFGRVRILSREDFDLANERGEMSFQDIIVLDHAPRDIEGVVGGVVTSAPQGELSHVAIRTSRRGTPNAFIAAAREVFSPYAGKLVRLEVGELSYCVREATPEESEDFWFGNRPSLSSLPQVDRDFRDLLTLEQIAAMELDGGGDAVSRFGGKATNLALLQSILDGESSEYRERGFGIPAHYYVEFMKSNRIESALVPGRVVSYAEYVEELLESEAFRSDSSVRFGALERLRLSMREDGIVDGDLVQRVAARVDDVFGTTTSRVRLRSSSTVEDTIEFNGAGLYDSKSACVADDLDADDSGPSLCEPVKDHEVGIARALRIVWSSLWNFRAYEERSFYSIPQSVAAMGLLVNRAFVDESANGVAFTGNPSNRLDRRYVVTAQVGETSVVSPDPGILAEKDVLEMSDGRVVRIVRAVKSSLVGDGEFVLPDARLEELGALLWRIDRDFPIDTGSHAREDVLLDIEFKIESKGDLAVKQVRSFLLSGPAEETPNFELVIPPGALACGVFGVGRGARREFELKSVVYFSSGTFSLPTSLESFQAELIESIELGPERLVAVPDGPGRFRVLRRFNSFDCQAGSDGGVTVTYHFDYSQELVLADDRVVDFTLLSSFETRDGVPVAESLVLDSETLTDVVVASSSFVDRGDVVDVVYSSCTHETLPLWEVRAEFADGTRVSLDERLRPAADLDFVPASVTESRLYLAGMERRLVSGYWHLVYSAARHNTREVYWMVLDPPAWMPGVASPVHVVELSGPVSVENRESMANYLGEDFELLRRVEVVSFDRVPGHESADFRRGDVNGDGLLNVSDVISLLQFLFLRGLEPPCMKSADALDDGVLNATDAVSILRALFGDEEGEGGLFGPCRTDPTADGLSCRVYGPCS